MRGSDSGRYAQEEIKAKSVDYDLIKRLASYLKPYRGWVFLAIVIIIISKSIEAWIPVQLGHIVQKILSVEGLKNSNSYEIFYHVVLACLFLLGLNLFSFSLDVINIVLKNRIGQKVIFSLRTQVYDHIQHLPMAYFDHSSIGRLMTRTIHDVEQLNQLFSESLVPLIGSLILFIGIFIALFFLDWRIGIMFCVIFPLTIGLVQIFRHQQRQGYYRIRSIVSALNTFLQEHLMGVNIIRNFGIDEIEKKKFDKINKDQYEANIDTLHNFSFFISGIDFLQNLTLIFGFFLLSYFLPVNGFQAGVFFTLSLYCMMIFRPMLDLAERYDILQAAMAAGERIFDILDTPIESPGSQPGLSLKTIESIVFDDVWFAYNKEEWILREFSFTLNKGESIAIVGMTGSGKTTIMNLLLRLYDFQKGTILINGKDIKKYSKEILRNFFGVILQDPVIFSGTVLDNISLFDSTLSFQDVKAAADYVHLTPFIERFPDSFKHHLSERGKSLSVGEMQLISLARVVAHKRDILIFDEATANIDIQTEKLIQETLKKILSHKTALIIAHRLSTIRDVTRIIVLYQGKIVETGTHEELMIKEGFYEKLIRFQFTN